MGKYRVLIAASLLLGGCASYDINKQYSFSDRNNEDLCLAAKWVYSTHNEEGVIYPYLQEIKKRNLMTEEKFRTVHNSIATIGDTKCFMFATRGRPHLRNITSTKYADHYQYIYRGWLGNFSYVYVDDNTITAIQN